MENNDFAATDPKKDTGTMGFGLEDWIGGTIPIMVASFRLGKNQNLQNLAMLESSEPKHLGAQNESFEPKALGGLERKF